MKKTYQGMPDKSKAKFEVLGKRELLLEVPLPMVEVWEELQAQVEELTGEAGLRIVGAILENEVTRRVGPPHRPDPTSGAVRWGRQPGFVMFGGGRWRWNDRVCAHALARKWNWRVTRGCNTTDGGSARCGKASLRD